MNLTALKAVIDHLEIAERKVKRFEAYANKSKANSTVLLQLDQSISGSFIVEVEQNKTDIFNQAKEAAEAELIAANNALISACKKYADK